MMNRGESAADNILKLHNPKSSAYRKKEYVNVKTGIITGKENIPQVKKMPGIDVPPSSFKLPMSPLNAAGKVKKYLDLHCDRHLTRGKGLQVDASNNNNVSAQKKRNNSNSDISGSLLRSRFAVYNDSIVSDETTGKLMSIKKIPAPTAIQKAPLQEISKDKSVAVQKEKEVAKLSAPKSKSTTVSPCNLPKIKISNISNIKEVHKKSQTKKTPKTAYAALSLELAYNIEYAQEYVMFQKEINEKKKLSSSFLMRYISADQRRLVVKYLIGVSAHFKYPSFTLYQSVKIFDAYIDAVDVSVMDLQMISLAALWIALKKDLIVDHIPDAVTVLSLAGPILSKDKKPLIDCEQKILMTLKFEISFADPFSLFALFTVMIDHVRNLIPGKVEELYYFGSYLIDISIMNEETCSIVAIDLVTICSEIALALVMPGDEDVSLPKWLYWRHQVYKSNPCIERYRLSDTELTIIRHQLLETVLLSKENTSDFYVIYKKYSTRRYGSISAVIVSKVMGLCL